MPREDEIRRLFGRYIFDGSEAVGAICTLMTSHSRPPDLRSAIRKILERYYRGCIPLDAVADYLDLERIEQ
jgi:hypothetical protein